MNYFFKKHFYLFFKCLSHLGSPQLFLLFLFQIMNSVQSCLNIITYSALKEAIITNNLCYLLCVKPGKAAHSSILAWRAPWTEAGHRPWGCKESNTSEEQTHSTTIFCSYKLVHCFAAAAAKLLPQGKTLSVLFYHHHHHHPCFTNWDTQAESLKNLFNAMQLISFRIKI